MTINIQQAGAHIHLVVKYFAKVQDHFYDLLSELSVRINSESKCLCVLKPKTAVV